MKRVKVSNVMKKQTNGDGESTSRAAPDSIVAGYLNTVFATLGDDKTAQTANNFSTYLTNFKDEPLLAKLSAAYANTIQLNDFGVITIGSSTATTYIGGYYRALVNGKIADFVKTMRPSVSVTDTEVSDYLTKLGMTAERKLEMFNEEVTSKTNTTAYQKYKTNSAAAIKSNLVALDKYIKRQFPDKSRLPLTFGSLELVEGGLEKALSTSVGYFMGTHDQSKDITTYCAVKHLSCANPEIGNTCGTIQSPIVNSIPLKFLALCVREDDSDKIQLAKDLELTTYELAAQYQTVLLDPVKYLKIKDFFDNHTFVNQPITEDIACSVKVDSLTYEDSLYRVSEPYLEPRYLKAAPGAANGLTTTVTVRRNVTFIELFVNIKNAYSNLDLFKVIDEDGDVDDGNDNGNDNGNNSTTTSKKYTPYLIGVIVLLVLMFIVILIFNTTKKPPQIIVGDFIRPLTPQ